MKLVLIALGLLATTGVVYAACVFCREIGRTKGRPGFDRAFSLTDFVSWTVFWPALGRRGHGSPEPLPAIRPKFDFSRVSLPLVGLSHRTNPGSGIHAACNCHTLDRERPWRPNSMLLRCRVKGNVVRPRAGP